MLWG
jgi:hypothetical protein